MNKLGIKVCNNAHYTVHNIGQNSLHSLSETSGLDGKNKGNIYFLKIAKVLVRHGQSSSRSPWARVEFLFENNHISLSDFYLTRLT